MAISKWNYRVVEEIINFLLRVTCLKQNVVV